MKRTAIKRKRPEWTPTPREDRPMAVLPAKVECRASYGAAVTFAIPKPRTFKSVVYENAVRDLGYCVRCGKVGRPQLCHRDEGKGMGLKTDSRECWAGCATCHFAIGTSGTYPKEERRALDLLYGRYTREALRRLGKWPAGVADYVETGAAPTAAE